MNIQKVNLNEAFVCECVTCGDRLLIVEAVKAGDKLMCRCGQAMSVGDIVGQYRSPTSPTVLLDCERIH